jgi:uncharacterized oligopeptide transporter (OPT) family protein
VPPEGEARREPRRHPSIFEPANLIFGVLFAVLGTIIGLEILPRVGVTPNSSVIAVIIAITLARIPVSFFHRFRDLARQNLLQTVISGASYAGANGILLPTGIVWLMGRIDLVLPMMLGAVCGVVISAILMYRLFDSKLFPASGVWPAGVATAECMIAGDRGGRRGLLLAAGAAAGALGHALGIPMDVFGVCWIGNIWALFMFGLGLLVRGYASPVAGIDVQAAYLPHGFMIGAGLVALVQIVRNVRAGPSPRDGRPAEIPAGRILAGGFLAYALSALIMAAAAGLATDMSPGGLVAFVVYAAFSGLVAQLIAGIAAMHSGWFPAFATAFVFLLVGMALGFAPVPLAFLVGFTASCSPAFADMGYDLKSGWLLRGEGSDPELERQGRRAQVAASVLGIAVAAVAVLLLHSSYFERDLFPPYDRVASATIAAGTSPSLAKALALWAVPGALLQAAGGPARQLGVLFATGLLIDFPAAGFTAMAALLARFLLVRRFGERAEAPMYILAGGFIAGSAVTGFVSATLKAHFTPRQGQL